MDVKKNNIIIIIIKNNHNKIVKPMRSVFFRCLFNRQNDDVIFLGFYLFFCVNVRGFWAGGFRPKSTDVWH